MSVQSPAEPASSARMIRVLTYMMFMMFAMTTDSVGVIIPRVIEEFERVPVSTSMEVHLLNVQPAFSRHIARFMKKHLSPFKWGNLKHFRRMIRQPRALAAHQRDMPAVYPAFEAIHHIG